MANSMLSDIVSFTKQKLVNEKQEVSIMNRSSMLDAITPKQRLTLPLRFRLYKFKFYISRLVLELGGAA